MSQSEKTLKERKRDFLQDMEDVEILKTKEAYGYYYAELKDIHRVINPILRKHGIWYGHFTSYDSNNKCNALHTYIYNVDKEDDLEECTTLIDNTVVLAKMNRFMVEGSAITYFRRYHITTLLCLIADEDTDAGGKVLPKGEGRSVEAASTKASTNFVEIFKTQLETKTLEQVNKTFDAYKSQMSKEDISAIEKLIKEKHNA